jgi:hypothetical protein
MRTSAPSGVGVTSSASSFAMGPTPPFTSIRYSSRTAIDVGTSLAVLPPAPSSAAGNFASLNANSAPSPTVVPPSITRDRSSIE